MQAKSFSRFGAGLTALAACALIMGAAVSVRAESQGVAPGEGDQWDRARAEVQGQLDTWSNIKESLFPGRTIEDGKDVISLETPYRALDASVVPISITAMKPQTAGQYIKDLYLIIDENPSPVAAVFHLTPDTGKADISTRVRVNKYTNVRAVAETNDGKLYMVANFVKATGGCSAPALNDKEAAMARLGKMKFKMLKGGGNELSEAQLLISHPNYSGLQFDQISRHEIPADFVKTLEVSVGDKKVFSADTDISISEDPSFIFHFVDPGSGEIKAMVTDSEGRKFEHSWPVSAKVEG
ncbi:MAG: quinoprotein dehydrogenase-associated SoxYZ-like carrier [Alphaproteobacteria bacterium]